MNIEHNKTCINCQSQLTFDFSTDRLCDLNNLQAFDVSENDTIAELTQYHMSTAYIFTCKKCDYINILINTED